MAAPRKYIQVDGSNDNSRWAPIPIDIEGIDVGNGEGGGFVPGEDGVTWESPSGDEGYALAPNRVSMHNGPDSLSLEVSGVRAEWYDSGTDSTKIANLRFPDGGGTIATEELVENAVTHLTERVDDIEGAGGGGGFEPGPDGVHWESGDNSYKLTSWGVETRDAGEVTTLNPFGILGGTATFSWTYDSDGVSVYREGEGGSYPQVLCFSEEKLKAGNSTYTYADSGVIATREWVLAQIADALA